MNSDTKLSPGCVLSNFLTDKVTFEVMAVNEDGTYAGELRCDGVLVALMDKFEANDDWETIEEPCDCDHCTTSWEAVTAEWTSRYGG